VGDLEGNAAKILASAREAAAADARLLVLTELVLPGYPPQDLLEEPSFVAACQSVGEELTRRLGAECPGLAVLFGNVALVEADGLKRLQNAAWLVQDGRLLAQPAKTLLPTYDVFDERRWFHPATSVRPVVLDGLRIGITICEDLWNDEFYWGQSRYQRDPVAELAEQGVDLLLNLSGSPYHRNKAGDRREMMAAAARRHSVPLVFANQVGGNDELIFDGGSCLFVSLGRHQVEGPRF
jgi:NAD+ synthase (glutamine-hydrolysing)